MTNGWAQNGKEAGLLFVIFEDGIYNPMQYKPKDLYDNEDLKKIFGKYKSASFSGYCKTQATKVKKFKTNGTMPNAAFKESIMTARKEHVDLLRKLAPANEYDDDGRLISDCPTFVDDEADPERPLDDSFLREGQEDNSNEPKKEEPQTEENNICTKKGNIANMKKKHQNTVVGRKLLDVSYPNGLAMGWIAHNKRCIDQYSTKILVGNITKKNVYRLRKLSKEATDSSVMLKKHNFNGSNNVHSNLIGQALKELKEEHQKEMRKLAPEVFVPEGWTCQLEFVLPFDVDDHLYDENGNVAEFPTSVGDGHQFWLRKRGTPEDDDSEIEVEMD